MLPIWFTIGVKLKADLEHGFCEADTTAYSRFWRVNIEVRRTNRPDLRLAK